MKFKELFSPIKINGLELKNRIILPGMMTKMAAPRSGDVTQTIIDYHVAKVKGGCALNITGAVAIDETTHGLGYLALYEDWHVQGWKRLADAIHAEGGKLCPQIWHGGIVNSLLEDDQNPMVTNEMTKEDIDYIVGRYANSTKLAVEAGADAIQLHAAHTYLPHTFLSSFWNKREDEYNGSLENRARFILEVIEAMRGEMPEDMPLLMRIDCFDDVAEDGLSMEDIIQVINWAAEKGVDVADISRGNSSSGLIYEVPSIETARGYNIENFSKIKKAVNIPVVGVGRVNDPKMANDIIKEGHADLIAIGRGQIADSEFANKAMRGEEDTIRKCIGGNTGCFDAIVDPEAITITCTRNPLCGKEGKEITTTDSPKNVLIVGGGLGGMTAADVLKNRGHNPMIYEASDKLGGQFLLAGKAPGLKENEEAAKWEANNVEKLGVDIKLNTKVTPELLEEIKPDEVIIATGGVPRTPDIPGIDSENVYSYQQVLDGEVKLSGNVVVIGGKRIGVNTALYLVGQGAKCTIIEDEERIASDMGWVNLINTMTTLHMKQVGQVAGAKVTSIADGKVNYLHEGQEKSAEYNYVVNAVGAESVASQELQDKCDELGIRYWVIGDAKEARIARFATSEATSAAVRI